jgi:hypothetical protein
MVLLLEHEGKNKLFIGIKESPLKPVLFSVISRYFITEGKRNNKHADNLTTKSTNTGMHTCYNHS